MPVHVVKLTLSLRPFVMKKVQSMVKYTFKKKYNCHEFNVPGLYLHIIVLQPGILSECMTISFPNELWSPPSFEHWTLCQNTRLAT